MVPQLRSFLRTREQTLQMEQKERKLQTSSDPPVSMGGRRSVSPPFLIRQFRQLMPLASSTSKLNRTLPARRQHSS
jgi:hypothetical protein